MTADALGRLIRARRRQQGLRQAELAALSDVGNRFLSDLEHGKPTVELGRVLLVLAALGLECEIRERNWADLESVDGATA